MSNTAQAPISLRTPSLSRIKTAKTEAERTDIVKEESNAPLSAHITPAGKSQPFSFPISSWVPQAALLFLVGSSVILVLAIFTGLFTYEKAAANLAATNNTASNYATAQEAATWAGYAKPQFICISTSSSSSGWLDGSTSEPGPGWSCRSASTVHSVTVIYRVPVREGDNGNVRAEKERRERTEIE
ncbi:hypothetical protein PROFUN_16567 [Planoprotostelium fungivorum]|uniref:Uncharacterized protein n=1 Tax=Planoprotostelium fungivorum TaxID=1890364 RepID=A0A2P6MQ21_9EUKA|nr:hypothetical protein PROFUN_16567 [Planoprotostelium fungivorum]